MFRSILFSVRKRLKEKSLNNIRKGYRFFIFNSRLRTFHKGAMTSATVVEERYAHLYENEKSFAEITYEEFELVKHTKGHLCAFVKKKVTSHPTEQSAM